MVMDHLLQLPSFSSMFGQDVNSILTLAVGRERKAGQGGGGGWEGVLPRKWNEDLFLVLTPDQSALWVEKDVLFRLHAKILTFI